MNIKAVILAGGKGTRLKPYTNNFPKPLMPVGDKPILEIIINQLKKADITDIVISTGYLEEMIRIFFMDGLKFGVNITYSKEEEPRGTAGPLNLVRDQLTDTFILMNGDVLSDINFHDFIAFHKKNGAEATIALCKRSVPIDFGVVEVDGSHIFSKWMEKPTLEYLVSTGIYVLEPSTLESLPHSGFFNLPDFICKLHEEKHKVLGYFHNGYWLDIGRPEDYERACVDQEEKGAW